MRRAGEGPPVSSGNSVGVAFSQPRVEGRSTSTLGIYIIRCSNSDGVAVSRRRYHNANPSLSICRGIIQLSITPTAKRNSYRVAILVGALPRVAGHARNPGLCNRNSYRVARGAYQPTVAPSHYYDDTVIDTNDKATSNRHATPCLQQLCRSYWGAYQLLCKIRDRAHLRGRQQQQLCRSCD